MKIAVLLVCLGVFSFFICFYAASGYTGKMQGDAPLYAFEENVPFDKMKVATVLKKGDFVSISRCYDIKTTFYFYITYIKSGVSGYLYDFDMTAEKNIRWPTSQEMGAPSGVRT